MAAIRLERRFVERIWGRRNLPAPFDGAKQAQEIGEIWFEGPAEAQLLVKYLFTSQPLSVQVHPSDAIAKAVGHASGKDEAWFILAAEPGASIGLGLTHEVSKDELRAAALDGTIEQLIDWKPVRAGQALFVPAGTIHAIGPGISLIEIQQNADITYRLYDYGRPRELHLEEALAAADPQPWQAAPGRRIDETRELLAAGGAFVLERWGHAGAGGTDAGETELLLIPLGPGTRIDGQEAAQGEVWQVSGRTRLEGSGDLLAAYPGGKPLPLFA